MTMTKKLLRYLKLFRRSCRGVAAVETALAFPIVLAIGSLCADMYSVGLERSRMERSSVQLPSSQYWRCSKI